MIHPKPIICPQCQLETVRAVFVITGAPLYYLEDDTVSCRPLVLDDLPGRILGAMCSCGWQMSAFDLVEYLNSGPLF